MMDVTAVQTMLTPLLTSVTFWLTTPVIVLSFMYWRMTQTEMWKIVLKTPSLNELPLLGTLHLCKRDSRDFYEQLFEFADHFRKEKLFRLRFLTKPVFIIFTADEVEKLVKSQNLLSKSKEYDYVHPWLGLGLLTSTGDRWRRKRRMLTPSFHFNILKDALTMMNEHAVNLKDKLQSAHCDTDKPVDIFHHLTLCSLDIICETSMGVKMDALHHEDSDYVKAVYLAKDSIYIRVRSPWYWPDIIFNNSSFGRSVNAAIAVMHQFAYKMISERRQGREGLLSESKHKVFLDTLLDCRDENGQPLTDEEIREEVDTFMFEGHDTVSSALGFSVHLLGTHPEIQAKCQQEIDDALGSSQTIEMEHLSKLVYLEWCAKEAMRLFPSVPFFARIIEGQDAEFGGYTIPDGAGSVTVLVPSLHRDPDVYPDPDRYDPTRFSPDECAKRSPFSYIPFSAGPRNCIGQKFAMMELKIILATLLRGFNIESTQKTSDLRPNPGLVLQPSNGIMVKLSSR